MTPPRTLNSKVSGKKTKSSSADNEPRLLTETELELMSHLWQRGEGTVADVQAALPADRPLAYTSVSTILRILEQKGILTTRKEGRGHVYIPLLSRTEYEDRWVNHTVQHTVQRVFDGEPLALVKQLLDRTQLNAKEIEELRQLLDLQEKA